MVGFPKSNPTTRFTMDSSLFSLIGRVGRVNDECRIACRVFIVWKSPYLPPGNPTNPTVFIKSFWAVVLRFARPAHDPTIWSGQTRPTAGRTVSLVVFESSVASVPSTAAA